MIPHQVKYGYCYSKNKKQNLNQFTNCIVYCVLYCFIFFKTHNFFGVKFQFQLFKHVDHLNNGKYSRITFKV